MPIWMRNSQVIWRSETKQLMEGGLTREEAEIEARRRFGSVALIAEDTRSVRGFALLGRLWQDVHYAVRVLRRAPVFTSAAVLSLALGIGAATAVFSVADTVYLRPLPYADSGRLVWVAVRFPKLGGPASGFVLSPNYIAWRHENHTFQQFAAVGARFAGVLTSDGEPIEVRGARISANFVDTFGYKPALGRTLRAEEELPNGPKALMLTYLLWRDHFHSRGSIVGSTIQLDGEPHTVAGILPRNFVFPFDDHIDIVIPLPAPPTASLHDRGMAAWTVFGRLNPGIGIAQAIADLDRLLALSRADAPQIFRPENTIAIEPLQEQRAGDAHTLLVILLSAAACLLAIACANVANLLLARWSSRARELAVRAAIGAARGRLARQLFAEIGVLIAAGTLAGMLLVKIALGGFVHFAAGELPRMNEAGVDFRVFGIAFLISVATALLFGALPLLRAGRIDLQFVLKNASRGATAGRQLMRRALVAMEVALSVVLLSGAALLFQTLWHMRNDRLGFPPEHLLTVSVPLRGSRYDAAARRELASEILNDLARMPGNQAASLTECSPLVGGRSSVVFSRSDRPLPEDWHRGDGIGICNTDAEYLRAAGTRLVRGRFLSQDDFHYPGTLAVINEAAAQTYFAGEDPVGKQILGGRAAGWKTVVGVVADTKNHGLNQAAAPEAWINDTLEIVSSDLLFLVRTLAPESVVAQTLRAGHPDLFSKVQTLDDDIAQQAANPRFNTALLSTFAAIAFLMAMVGVYGVLAFSVAQRRAEIGIRMALGAAPDSVLAMVMKESAATLMAGAAVGVGGALLLGRYLTTLLYDIKPNDPVTYIGVVAGLAIAALCASFLPARRASQLDPAIALRHE